jgi:hypothetical protein
MPVFKRELAFVADRPTENAGDWWHLVGRLPWDLV